MATRSRRKGGGGGALAGFLVLAAVLGIFRPSERSSMPSQSPVATPASVEASTPVEVVQAPAIANTSKLPNGAAGGLQQNGPAQILPLFSVPVATVSGKSVNVRATPDPNGMRVARLKKGEQVNVLRRDGGWSQVSIPGRRLQGWISSNYLTSPKAAPLPLPSKPRPASKSKPQKPAKQIPVKPTLDRSAAVQQIIASSISSYGGRCPCPYSTDRAGRSCGRRSAYSRPGGAAPLCYPSDVTNAMIQQWLSR